MKNYLNFFVSLVFITTIFVIGGVRIIQFPDAQLQTGEWVMHTHEVLQQLDMLSLHLDQAEVGKRNYILTSDPQYQSLYRMSLNRVGKDLQNFQSLTQDNPVQQKRIPVLKKNIDEKIAELEKTDNDLNILGPLKTFQTFVNGQSLHLTGQINQQIADMSADEESLLKMRLQKWQAQSTTARLYLVAGAVFLYFIFCGMFITLYRNKSRTFAPV